MVSGLQSNFGSPAHRNPFGQPPVRSPLNLYWPQFERQPTTLSAPELPTGKKVSCLRLTANRSGHPKRRSCPQNIMGRFFGSFSQVFGSLGGFAFSVYGAIGTISMLMFTPSTVLMSGAALWFRSSKVHSARDFGPGGVRPALLQSYFPPQSPVSHCAMSLAMSYLQPVRAQKTGPRPPLIWCSLGIVRSHASGMSMVRTPPAGRTQVPSRGSTDLGGSFSRCAALAAASTVVLDSLISCTT